MRSDSMKIVPTLSIENEQLYITSYGFEDISKNAHWGKGSRDTFIIHYVLGGEGVFNGNPVKKGEGFVITPKTSHEYHSSQNNPWKYFWLTFNGTSAHDICKKYIFSNELNIFKFGKEFGVFLYPFKEMAIFKICPGLFPRGRFTFEQF